MCVSATEISARHVGDSRMCVYAASCVCTYGGRTGIKSVDQPWVFPSPRMPAPWACASKSCASTMDAAVLPYRCALCLVVYGLTYTQHTQDACTPGKCLVQRTRHASTMDVAAAPWVLTHPESAMGVYAPWVRNSTSYSCD